MIRALSLLSPGPRRASSLAIRLTFMKVSFRAIPLACSFFPRRAYILRLSRILPSMVECAYPALSHTVMTWRSIASDASARTLRSTLGDTPSQDRLFNRNYEELKACDLSSRRSFRGRDPPD